MVVSLQGRGKTHCIDSVQRDAVQRACNEVTLELVLSELDWMVQEGWCKSIDLSVIWKLM